MRSVGEGQFDVATVEGRFLLQHQGFQSSSVFARGRRRFGVA